MNKQTKIDRAGLEPAQRFLSGTVTTSTDALSVRLLRRRTLPGTLARSSATELPILAEIGILSIDRIPDLASSH